MHTQRSEAHSAQTQASGHDAPRGTSFADQHAQHLSEAQPAPANVGAGNRPSFRLQPMIQAARHQLGLMAAKAAPRQPQAPQPNSLSAAAVPDALPSHELSVPPLAKAASAAPRMQPLNLARSQGPEKKIAEKAEPSSESVHVARRGASSSDQHTPPDVSEIQHASTDAGASSWLSSLLQPMIKAAPTPRQPEAPHPGSVSAARPLVEPPAKQGSIPPVETAASAALRKQSPNLATSQRPEEQIAQSSESQHGTRRGASSTDQHYPGAIRNSARLSRCRRKLAAVFPFTVDDPDCAHSAAAESSTPRLGFGGPRARCAARQAGDYTAGRNSRLCGAEAIVPTLKPSLRGSRAR